MVFQVQRNKRYPVATRGVSSIYGIRWFATWSSFDQVFATRQPGKMVALKNDVRVPAVMAPAMPARCSMAGHNHLLPRHGTQYVFIMEQQEYTREEINWSYIEFADNQDVLNLFGKARRRSCVSASSKPFWRLQCLVIWELTNSIKLV